jgi:fructokinase
MDVDGADREADPLMAPRPSCSPTSCRPAVSPRRSSGGRGGPCLSGRSVVGIGEILWDLPPGGPRLGGAPFNAIVHLARFGCRTAFVARLVGTSWGNARRKRADSGVATSLIEVNEQPTGVVRVELDPEGVPTYQIVSPAAYEAREPLPPDRAFEDGADLVVFGTLAQRFEGVRTATQQIAQANQRAARLYDVNLRPGCWKQRGELLAAR